MAPGCTMMNPMLLVMDIGNTETELGLFPLREDGTTLSELVAQWRVCTPQRQTADEHGVLLRQLFAMQGLEPKVVRGIIVASVVPPLDSLIRNVCERTFGIKAIFVEPGVRTGMPVHYDNPCRGRCRPHRQLRGRLRALPAELHRGGLRHGHHL